ncbi:MAG: hypothetical protein IKU29_06835 [Parabacteroides sp.]|nr:hypothetical protein [Parabacteroides sp.]
MKIEFTRKTNKDFQRHKEYLLRIGKADGHKYQKYELDGISKSLKSNISKGLKNTKEHKNSIFSKKFEYNYDSYKMYVDKKSHHIIFYKVITPKTGDPYISVEKCIHSAELKKELEEKGIEPLKNCNKSLLDDLKTVYKEDEVKSKEDSDEEFEEDTDEEGNPRQHKTGPRGGKYYRVKTNGKWGPWNSEINDSLKDLRTLIVESSLVSLKDFLNKLGM